MKAAVLARPLRRPGYLLSRLLLVVLAVVVPLLALQALSLLNDKRAAEEASFRSLRARADGAAASVEDVLSRAEQLLVFLASRDQVRSLDRAGCSSLVRGVSAVGRVYANVLLIDVHGRQVCSAVPGLAPDRFEDQPWFRAGLQREGFTLGAPIVGRFTGRHVALLTLPVNAGGEKVGVLAAALDMRALSGLLTREDLPPGATLNVVQGGARSISRLPYDDASIGRGLGEALQATQGDATAVTTAAGEDGVLRAFAARPIPKYGLSVLAGMPAQAMHAQANEGLLRSVAIAALVAGLGLAAAFLASRRLAAPLRSIAGTARRLQAGETTTRADEALPGEFGEVAVELNRLLDRHDARTAELRLSEKHALRIGAFYEALSSTNQAIVRMDPEHLFQEICLVCVRTQLADVAWVGLVEGSAIQPVAGAGRGCEHKDVRSAARRLSTEPLAASAVRQGYPVKDDDFQGHSRDMSWLDCLPGFEVRSAAAFPFSCDGVVAGVLTLYVGEPRYFDGELVALLQNMMRDISLALEAHKRKASTAAMLDAQAANRAKTTFLSNISHELRTPLNAILGFTQLLQIHARDALDQQARQQLDHVSMAGTQLRALIDDLMDVSRIEAGEVTLQLKEVELPALLDTVVALSEPLAQTHQVTLQADYARSLPLRFCTDPTRLRQVLLNLLSNAIKYNRPGGQVRFSASCEDGRLMLRVVDDGIGMSPSQLRELFQGFNRLGRESSAIEGTGIGLRLTRQLVGLLGGELGVQSAENEGTQVSVTLPCRPAAEGAAPLRVLGGQVTLSRARGVVLYIEDNPVNAQLMEHLLHALPEVRLVVSATGAEGLAQAAALQPDLVLLDMHLPDMSGLEVLSRLRGADPAKAPRVVALSASAMPDEVGAAMQAGVEAYWTKPIDFAQVLQGVADRLSPAANAPHAGWRRLSGTA